jgi:4-hydroxythreonine-4-phosphate dehydrogenase
MGIGPEVTARALVEIGHVAAMTLIGDGEAIGRHLHAVGMKFEAVSTVDAVAGISVLDTRGVDSPAPVEAIRQAAQACMDGRAHAMVTGPIHKADLIEQGFEYIGHTEMLGSICGVEPVMAFVGGAVRVALVTTHIPLDRVRSNITQERVIHTVRTAHDALCKDLGFERPRLVLCGLNPHSGESGQLGDCETLVLQPAVHSLTSEGIDVVGPLSAETAFMEAVRGGFDMVIAMYHDQGLVPLKSLSFGDSVNWTIGLPIIRTSVDHGTAKDLVGTGLADPASMVSAIRLALQIATR